MNDIFQNYRHRFPSKKMNIKQNHFYLSIYFEVAIIWVLNPHHRSCNVIVLIYGLKSKATKVMTIKQIRFIYRLNEEKNNIAEGE